MKYLERLKSEKRADEVLPKLPKAPFDSKDSTDARHFQKNSPALIPVEPPPEWQQDLCEAHAGRQQESVKCGDCQHFERDVINPHQGMGGCLAGESPGYPYPMTPRLCPSFQRQGSQAKQVPHSVALVPVAQWQDDFCIAHAEFNDWRGQCPVDLDECLISKIIDSGGNLDQLRGLDLGHGITTDMVIDEWLRSNEPAAELLTKPSWFICMAESIWRAA